MRTNDGVGRQGREGKDAGSASDSVPGLNQHDRTNRDYAKGD